MTKALITASCLLLLAGASSAYERVYTLGEKIDGAALVVWAEVAEVREIAAAGAKKPGKIGARYVLMKP
jgi:hypothetical protein